MTRELKRAAIAVGRRYGASPQARARMIEENSRLTWVGHCRKCKKTVKGTPSKLKNHVCEEVPVGE
jgi:hypothetical protein